MNVYLYTQIWINVFYCVTNMKITKYKKKYKKSVENNKINVYELLTIH